MNNNKGFTLMEILIAMAIMGILAGIGIGSYTVSLQKGRDAQRKSDLSQIQTALESYQNDFNSYPLSSDGKLAGCDDGKSVCGWGEEFSLSSGKVYMKKLPVAPRNSEEYVYVSNGIKYQIFARLENVKDQSVSTYEIPCPGGENCNYGVSSANASPDEAL